MTVLAERYELTRPLGSGGMAEVYAARDRLLERPVAIKLIHHAHLQDPVGRERFAREARVAAGLQHPNTVAVFDAGDEDGRPFIVMELVDGRSLADRLREEGRLPVVETVVIGDAVLAGLGAAHDRGLVHRDVKPSNILLPATGGVKLADFGIATALADGSAQLTGTGQVLGTPSYLAPECVGGQRATPASDLYALGAVLYECLTGRPPFEAETPVALAVAHQRAPVPPLAETAPHVPVAVAAVVERALAKHPTARFSDAQEMRQALSDAAGSGVVPAGPPTPATAESTQLMASPAAERRAWPMALATVVVLAVLVAAAYLLLRHQDPDQAAPSTPQDEAAEEPPAEDEDPADEAAADDEEAADDDQADDQELTGLDELIAIVAANPAAAGEKGADLLGKLQDLSANPDDEDARDLIEEIADWMAKGELDADVGRLAVTVLEQESRPDDPQLHDVSRLFADVASTLPEWGEKGEDLLADLAALLGIGPPGQQLQEARSMLEEIDTWVADGEIDPNRAQESIAVLSPLVPPD